MSTRAVGASCASQVRLRVKDKGSKEKVFVTAELRVARSLQDYTALGAGAPCAFGFTALNKNTRFVESAGHGFEKWTPLYLCEPSPFAALKDEQAERASVRSTPPPSGFGLSIDCRLDWPGPRSPACHTTATWWLGWSCLL